jgi:tRNA-splicing ligase RtcB
MGIKEYGLVQVDEYRWDIPKSGDMRVPARVFADRKLLEKIAEDRSPEQARNVATLPGIVGRSLAMPDMHWGYGFPIGGVAAFDPEKEGVVSPGGIGYDVNCFTKSTPILHEHGYVLPIVDFASRWSTGVLRCQEFAAGRDTATPVVRFLALPPRRPVRRLTTATGRTVEATADHPFYTPQGMVELEKLWPGDRVAIYPFEGVPYEEPDDKVLVTEDDIRELLLRQGKGERGNALGQTLTHLRRLELLPLRYSSPQLPHLLKLVGFVFGDGNIHFTGGHGKGVTWFWGKAEDLEDIRADVAALGFTPSRIYVRQRQHAIDTTYGRSEFEFVEHSFKVAGSAFAILLHALGAPVGNKAAQDYTLPAWLFDAPLWQVRLFLAALFGAELSSPQAYASHNHSFNCPMLSMNKRVGYVESGREFLQGISQLLARFGVKTQAISQRQEYCNAAGDISIRLRLVLGSKAFSLFHLWSRVGFEYNRQRRYLANVAAQYVRMKLCAQHFPYTMPSLLPATVSLVESLPLGTDSRPVRYPWGWSSGRQEWERAGHEGHFNPNLSRDLPTFDEFRAAVTEGLGESGMVWEDVAAVEPSDYQGLVYDFTVAHPDHNFVANSFVVSNCGVRLVRSNLTLPDVQGKMRDLVAALHRDVPAGVGSRGDILSDLSRAKGALVKGVQWAIEQGYGWPEDAAHCEENGAMPGADPEVARKYSPKAFERGRNQLGTLGSGNHFLEIDVVEEVFDEAIAQVFGLFQGQVVLQIHSGSRGFGHQVCDDFIRVLSDATRKYGIQLPDRQLACAPVKSPEGQAYIASMAAAANYAWANRQCLMHLAREAIAHALRTSPGKLELHLVYDVAHNIGKAEKHLVEGKERLLFVHRKGATRAFPAGRPEVPADYRAVGQPVLVPGDMGRASYVLVGLPQAMEETWGSSCHGAGRMLSRTAAVKRGQGRNIRKELEAKGIIVMSTERDILAEEMPEAYKDVSNVVDVMAGAGLCRKVVRLRPLGVVKG